MLDVDVKFSLVVTCRVKVHTGVVGNEGYSSFVLGCIEVRTS